MASPESDDIRASIAAQVSLAGSGLAANLNRRYPETNEPSKKFQDVPRAESETRPRRQKGLPPSLSAPARERKTLNMLGTSSILGLVADKERSQLVMAVRCEHPVADVGSLIHKLPVNEYPAFVVGRPETNDRDVLAVRAEREVAG